MSQETTFDAAPAEPQLTGVRNFRDVGGLPTVDGRRIRPGRLFRSGHLAHATPEDTEFLSGLGLHTIFDFRNEADIALEGPDVELPAVRNLNMPLSDPSHGADFWRIVRDGDVETLRETLGDGQAARNMTASYRRIILDRTGEHGRLLRELYDNEGLPALLHCAAGKDRAGLSIMVIQLALGVTPEAIEADYLESNAHRRRYRIHRSDEHRAAPNPEAIALLTPLFEARAEYLNTALATIDEEWGGPDRYLAEALGCGPQERERLRTLLLDDGADA